MKRLHGKVAVITGGASGIGEATVRRFVEEGARVAFTDRDGDCGAQVASEIQAQGGDVLFVEAHMEHEDEAIRFVRQAATHFGRLDILVNNASTRLYQPVTEASRASWDIVIGINVMGYIYCAKAAIPAMRRAGGGSVVHVTASRAVVTGANMVQYDTSKAAIIGLTRGMARDHAKDNVRVNAISPGPIMTPLQSPGVEVPRSTHDAKQDELECGTLLQRPGTPQEVASCILFLVSDDASFVTGTCLFVDGGQMAL